MNVTVGFSAFERSIYFLDSWANISLLPGMKELNMVGEIRKFGTLPACSATTKGASVEWMPPLDSAHLKGQTTFSTAWLTLVCGHTWRLNLRGEIPKIGTLPACSATTKWASVEWRSPYDSAHSKGQTIFLTVGLILVCCQHRRV